MNGIRRAHRRQFLAIEPVIDDQWHVAMDQKRMSPQIGKRSWRPAAFDHRFGCNYDNPVVANLSRIEAWIDFLRKGDRRIQPLRSEERRVGKECGSTCRSRWSPSHSKKKKI